MPMGHRPATDEREIQHRTGMICAGPRGRKWEGYPL
jgi:hypothetical protein